MLFRTVVLAAGIGALVAWTLSVPADVRGTPDALTADGGRYHGPLREGRMHGRGRIEWEAGDRYEGDFESGRFSGQGTRVDALGRHYHGGFRAGLFEGRGRYESPQGEVFEGEFVRNRLTGLGRFTGKDGTTYEGRFEDWLFHGHGRFRNPQGYVYEGEFVRGELRGKGTVTRPDGGLYEGEVRDWTPHGQGVLRLSSGDVYTGAFEYGDYHGRGTLRYAKAQADGRMQDEGNWVRGELDDPTRRQRVLSNVESALYGQRELLQGALDGLATRRPDTINLYMLAVGGDGTQEVFRREVEFVENQFAQRFGARGRIVSLINSRQTGATRPMATHVSIERTLRALAARMDKERDILFLYLTSHGSKAHELTLDQEGMRLRDLPAPELARMVRQTGVRWKVIVVSACYSGGFIDALKDDHTLIITAARRDRQSFGCSDDNDFTYFGRAFFQEALPRSASFQDAFARARTLVEEWERRDITGRGAVPEDEYSYPQMHDPAPAAEYLRRWWPRAVARGPG